MAHMIGMDQLAKPTVVRRRGVGSQLAYLQKRNALLLRDCTQAIAITLHYLSLSGIGDAIPIRSCNQDYRNVPAISKTNHREHVLDILFLRNSRDSPYSYRTIVLFSRSQPVGGVGKRLAMIH